MQQSEINKMITSFGGRLQGGINWTWALFTDDSMGQACLDELRKADPMLEDRGYYDGEGFRFR